jgi:hypothetical protein
MKKVMLAMALVAGSALAAPRISIGIGFGAPAPVAVRPACPGPDYVWVDGYYGPSGAWMPGFWRAPVVVAPASPRFYTYDHHGREFHRDSRHDFRR